MSANPKRNETSQIDFQQDTSQMNSLLAGTEAPFSNNSVNIKVSIIIPVYNTAEYLPQCLESAINQTLKEIEIIVIDDASTDNSLQIIRNYESLDDRIKVIAFAENQGNGFGRNEAIRKARGEYIMFLDSDDWADVNAGEALYTKAIEQQYDMVMCGYVWHQTHIMNNNRNKQIFLPVVNDNEPEFFRYLLQQIKGLSCMPWQYLFLTEMLVKNSVRFAEGVYFEDVIFTIKAAHYAKSRGVVKATLLNYRYRTNSITHSVSKKKICDMHTSLISVKEFLDEKKIFKKYQKEYLIRYLQHAVCLSFLDYFRLPEAERDFELDEYMSDIRKSSLLRLENLSLFRAEAQRFGEVERNTRQIYIAFHKILYNLKYHYVLFKVIFKSYYWICGLRDCGLAQLLNIRNASIDKSIALKLNMLGKGSVIIPSQFRVQ